MGYIALHGIYRDRGIALVASPEAFSFIGMDHNLEETYRSVM